MWGGNKRTRGGSDSKLGLRSNKEKREDRELQGLVWSKMKGNNPTTRGSEKKKRKILWGLKNKRKGVIKETGA